MGEENDIEKQQTFIKLLAQGLSLTKRELEVFYLLAKGKKNREIAEAFHISPFTVKIHRANIYKKLKVNNKFALGKIAVQMGLL